jgi:hypothetical protein
VTLSSQIELARRTIEKAISVAERLGCGEFSEHLRISLSDTISEIEQGPTVICCTFRITEPLELVCVYIGQDNGVGITVLRDSIADALLPFLKTRTDIILKKLPEGFKICRRDVR